MQKNWGPEYSNWYAVQEIVKQGVEGIMHEIKDIIKQEVKESITEELRDGIKTEINNAIRREFKRGINENEGHNKFFNETADPQSEEEGNVSSLHRTLYFNDAESCTLL